MTQLAFPRSLAPRSTAAPHLEFYFTFASKARCIPQGVVRARDAEVALAPAT